MLAKEIDVGLRPHPLAGQPEASPDAEASLADEILSRARARAAKNNLAYAGEVTPQEAWTLFSSGAAVIVDVRTAEELHFVGQVPDAPHVAWATGSAMTKNPRFLRELEAKVAKDVPVLLLCRSAKRSHSAAEAAAKGGFRHAFNILEGFEGDLDEHGQRGHTGGWRYQGLPWTQL
jgi:rhodanese-related sulfurtransferase